MQPERAERILTWLLRALGGLTVLAVFAIFLPTDWMAVANDRLGLAPLPRTPLTEYLTRTLSAIYALVGALTLFVSRDVRRYTAFIAFAGRLTVVLGLLFVVIDVWAELPSAWVWSEGPFAVVVGIGLTWLAQRVEG